MLLLLFAPLLYLFSIGPVVWLYDRQYLSKSSEPVLEVVYVPLQYAYDSSPAVAHMLDGYLNLWRAAPVPVVTPAASPYSAPALPAPAPAGS